MSKPKHIYLVASYTMKPRDGVNTSQPGWNKDPEKYRYDERVDIVRGLKARDLQAQVVLDLVAKKVEKNAYATGKSFDEIFEYFFENYSQYITQVMSQLDPDYLKATVDRIQGELDKTEDAQEVSAE